MTRSPLQHRYDAPAGEICWFEWGSIGTKPTLLLLHATGFHARCWDATVAALPDDQHVIALDLRGHGRSYRPNSLSDWMATAQDVVAFVNAQFTVPVVAVGHSMGGYVAARAAAIVPDRFVHLLLVDPVMLVPETYAQEPDGQEARTPTTPSRAAAMRGIAPNR